MVFSSFLFLAVFLPVFLMLYHVTPVRWRNLTALFASLSFYAWGAPKILPLLLLSSLSDLILSRYLAPEVYRVRTRKRALSIALSVNIGLLLYFKYSNFFVAEINRLLGALGGGSFGWTAVALPIGISFFTFQKISYLVDVYRGIVPPAKSFVTYTLFVVLFPQLIAGPIVRYRQIVDQLAKRTVTLDDFYIGVTRFCIGLGKKVLIADSLGLVMDNALHFSPDKLSMPYAWLGIVCYAFQIFFDFSGYSDMAIGLGRMMGFRLPENFNAPYISQNFTEFWRRWHMTLSTWMKEYLYIPLGGNRVSPFRMYLNLWIVFFLSGLWHGASWSFVVWGCFHGFFLVLDKLWWLRFSKALPRVLNIALTFMLVCIGWVFFRAPDLPQAMAYLGCMFDLGSLVAEPRIYRGAFMNNRALVMLLAGAVIAFGPALLPKIRADVEWRLPSARLALQGTLSIACLVLSVCALAARGYTPFLYFKF